MELLFYCNQQSSVLEQPVPLTNAVNQQRRKRLYSVVRNGAAALDLQRFLVILHVPVVDAMMIYVANLIQAWNVSVKVVNSAFDAKRRFVSAVIGLCFSVSTDRIRDFLKLFKSKLVLRA